MNARVFVLVLAIGLFMAVWNADQRPLKVAVAKYDPARIIVSGTMVPEAPHIAAVEGQSDVVPHHVAADENAGEEPETLPEPDSARVDRDAAQLDAMLSIEEDDNTGTMPLEGASGKVESSSVMTSGTESRADLIPTFASVDDVIVFGIPAEEPVEDDDSDIAASRSPDDAPLPKEFLPSIIPVPRDLPAGVWNVLSQSGEAFRMTIERTSPGPESADRFCVRSSPDGDRWCFVRATEPVMSVEPTSSSRQVSTEFWSPTEKQ